MSNMLESGAAWLAARQDTYASVEIVYARPDSGGPSLAMTAVLGRSVFEQTTRQGTLVRAEYRDFIVDAAKLVDNGTAFLPAVGDKVYWGVSVYEVRAPEGVPHWAGVDGARTRIRVHTIEVPA